MKKPWIGIPTRYHDKSETLGQIRHYLDAILWAGGLPLMIPTVEPPGLVLEYARCVDGILLPGSPTDLNPAGYGEEPHPKLGKPYPERDATDFALLRYADETGLPLLGICFGAQSLNVHRGGSLVQDIPSQVGRPLTHDEKGEDPVVAARHPISIAGSTLLAKIAGKDALEVNSYHHQSVARAGRDLRVSATAPDGVIEAIEDTSGRFVLGVQWHPERTWREDPTSRALFSAFVGEAQKSTSGSHPV